MNVQGKSLQDILNAGSRRLEELEQVEKSALADSAEAHLDERARVEPESLKTLEERTDQLEEEIRAFLARGLERVQKTVESESQESQRQISRMVEGLVLLTSKFSESISQLRTIAENQVNDAGLDCQQVYDLKSQITQSELSSQASSALEESLSEAIVGQRKLAEQAEQGWLSIQANERQSMAKLVDCFDKNSEQVSASFQQAQSRLQERAQDRLSTLESHVQVAEDGIKNLVQKVVEQSDRHALDTDVKLKERFSTMLFDLMSAFDEEAKQVGSSIDSLHDTSLSDLTKKSKELSSGVEGLAETLRKSASNHSQDLQDKGSSLVDHYTDELNQKLEASNVFQRQLESERAQMVSEIWNELTDLRTKFDEKLQSLSQQTLQKMRTICEEAEAAISEAQESCCNDSKAYAQSKQQAIDSATKEFLSRLEGTRNAALDRIAKASGSAEIVTDPPVEKKSESKKRKEESSVADDVTTEDHAILEHGDDAEAPPVDEVSDHSNPQHAGGEPHASDDSDAPKRRKTKSDKKSAGESK